MSEFDLYGYWYAQVPVKINETKFSFVARLRTMFDENHLRTCHKYHVVVFNLISLSPINHTWPGELERGVFTLSIVCTTIIWYCTRSFGTVGSRWNKNKCQFLLVIRPIETVLSYIQSSILCCPMPFLSDSNQVIPRHFFYYTLSLRSSR